MAEMKDFDAARVDALADDVAVVVRRSWVAEVQIERIAGGGTRRARRTGEENPHGLQTRVEPNKPTVDMLDG